MKTHSDPPQKKNFIGKAVSRVFGKQSSVQRDALYGYFFIAPQTLGFLLFVLGPIVAIFVFALQDRNLLTGTTTFIGLENFRTMLHDDPLFKKTLLNSLVFTAGLVPLNVTLALTLALMLSRKFFGMTFFRMLFFAPVVTSAVAWAIVWQFILQGEQGTLNQFLAMIGIDGPNWLREPNWAMVSIIVTRVFKNVGLNMIICMAAIADLPRELMESAQVDGASSWQVLRYITLPLLAPTTLMVTMLTVIGSLKVFDQILLMTAGGPSNATMVLVYYVYYQAFQFFEAGYGSALAVILFIVALALTLFQWSLRREVVYTEEE